MIFLFLKIFLTVSLKVNNNVSTKGQQEIISKTQSIDTIESELKSKLLFIRRISSDRITCQICRAESQQRHDNITQVLRHVGKLKKKRKNTVREKISADSLLSLPPSLPRSLLSLPSLAPSHPPSSLSPSLSPAPLSLFFSINRYNRFILIYVTVILNTDSEHKYNVSKMLKSTKLTQQNSRITYVSPTFSSTQDASTLTHEMVILIYYLLC